MTTTARNLPTGTIIAGLVLCAALAACGTTSNIRSSASADGAAAGTARGAASRIDASGYDRIVVLDFVDATGKGGLSPEQARSHDQAMASAVRVFPDLIAQKLRESGAYREVVRGPAQGRALVVSGRITRLVEGSGALRFWVGMGAGSSYFDATTELADSETGQSLGQVVTDKNSWALGGIIAASQTVASFMEGAAQKIATELAAARRGMAARNTH